MARGVRAEGSMVSVDISAGLGSPAASTWSECPVWIEGRFFDAASRVGNAGVEITSDGVTTFIVRAGVVLTAADVKAEGTAPRLEAVEVLESHGLEGDAGFGESSSAKVLVES